LSPYSAVISLKRSFITNKSGVTLLPPRKPASVPNDGLVSDYADLAEKNVQLKSELDALKVDYAYSFDECNKANERIKSLEMEVTKLSIKHENNDPTLKDTIEHEVKRLNNENTWYKDKINAHVEEIRGLEDSLKVKLNIINQLTKKFTEFKTKNEKETAANNKSLRSSRGEKN